VQTRVAVVTAFNAPVEIWNVPVPALEDGGVLVKVDAATLCGTDAHRWQQHLKVELPFVPGHETCGTIVDMRGSVVDIYDKPLAVGDRIITSYTNCGHCFWCQVSRQTQLCPNIRFFGASHPERLAGGCAEYQYFPPHASLIRVPDEISSPLAASSACALRTVVHAFEHIERIDPHETVVVQGAGPLGLYAAALARTRGAKRILLIGAPAARLAVATDFGADDVLNMDLVPDAGERAEWVRARTANRGADIVVNCASTHALVEAFDLVRRGGRIINVGVGGDATLKLVHPLVFKAVNVAFVVMAEARHFLQAVDFLARYRERFPFEKMLSGRYPLERTTDALAGMASFAEIKPVILPNAPV
jgi:L-iditol 2-dehydrogenase